MIAGTVIVVHGPWGERIEKSLSAVAAALAEQGSELRHVEVPARGLPRHAEAAPYFVATPAVLVEGWRAARHLEALTEPGDVVLVPETASAGAGLFALDQVSREPGERRRLLVAAGDGEALRRLVSSGTIDGVEVDVAHAIDWEVVAYRYADAVLATSRFAATLLGGFDVEASVVAAADSVAPAPPPPPRDEDILVADPPSRLARTGEVLRGLSSVTSGQVFVADGDHPDGIFLGTTWDALSGLRETYGDRLHRGAPNDPATVIIGDPFRLPDDDLRAMRATARLIVPEAGALAERWPEADTWREADDLAALVAGSSISSQATAPRPTIELDAPSWNAERAQQVSVAVPVFGDTRFLEECVDSILGQTQAPVEILLVDDGSSSPAVTAVLEAMVAKRPDVIRLLEQPNRGVCAARNTAWQEMIGDAFLFVDADDVLDPSFIEAAANGLRGDAKAWAVATWTRFFGGYEGVEAKPPFDRRVGLRENAIVGTAALLAAESRDAGIRFSPDMAFLYCEDWEVWSKVVAAGGRVGLVPRPLAAHRVHPSSGGYMRTDHALAVGKVRATAPLLSDEIRQGLD